MCLGDISGWEGDGEWRKKNEETKTNFFKAIRDAIPFRIKELAKKSREELREYIKEMEGYGCYGEAGLAKKALKRKRCFLFRLFNL